MNTRSLLLPLLPALVLGLADCSRQKQELTRAEATQALEEAQLDTEAQTLASSAIELSTHFTIGEAVQRAAEELGDFITSQLPCADVQLEDATLSVQYGVKPGTCSYRGHAFTGRTSITVSRNDAGDVVVQHGWQALSNGTLSLDGTATVTWSALAETRHVTHELTWTRLADGRRGVGSGDRVQGVLPGGLSEGFTESGSRSWQGSGGTWDLAIEETELRWVDPLPQAGRYVLRSPAGKSLSIGFSRVNAYTIRVLVTNGSYSFDYDVIAAGLRED